MGSSEPYEPLLLPTATASTASSGDDEDIARGRVVVCPVDSLPDDLSEKRRTKFSMRNTSGREACGANWGWEVE